MERRDLLKGGLGLAITSCFKGARSKPSQELYPFKLDDVNPNSKTYKSQLGPQDYQEGLLLVNFAATWCIPCRKEFPHFEEVYKKGGINILVVNVEDDMPWENMSDFGDYTYPFLFHGKFTQEKGSDVAKRYKVRRLPRSYIFKDGEFEKIQQGAFSKKELQELVDESK